MQQLILLGQFGPSEWIGLAAIWLTLMGGLIHAVWKLSAMDERLRQIEPIVPKVNEHEVRLVRLEERQPQDA